MPRPASPEPLIRKSVTLPAALWESVRDVFYGDRLTSEADAVRTLLVEALEARASPKPKPARAGKG